MSVPDGQPDNSGCPFCKRIEEVDYDGEDRGCVSFEPLNPVTRGHRLFVPRQHVWDASRAPHVTADVFEVAALYARARNVDFNLITSAGAAATQTVRHLHVHYVPRREGDGLMLPWSAS